MTGPALFFVPFKKIQTHNEERRVVCGYASTEALDSDGERISKEAIETALPDYMKFGNIREMHQDWAAGRVVSADMDGKGLYVCAKISDDQAWMKIKDGTYKGFSIGGKKVRKNMLDPRVIDRIKLTEISVVDRPANPEAVFDIVKFDKRGHFEGNVDCCLACKLEKQQEDFKPQTLVFSKERFDSSADAKAWARENGFKDEDVDETSTSYRLRQREPGDFKEGSFRTKEITDGVSLVLGALKVAKVEKAESPPTGAQPPANAGEAGNYSAPEKSSGQGGRTVKPQAPAQGEAGNESEPKGPAPKVLGKNEASYPLRKIAAYAAVHKMGECPGLNLVISFIQSLHDLVHLRDMTLAEEGQEGAHAGTGIGQGLDGVVSTMADLASAKLAEELEELSSNLTNKKRLGILGSPVQVTQQNLPPAQSQDGFRRLAKICDELADGGAGLTKATAENLERVYRAFKVLSDHRGEKTMTRLEAMRKSIKDELEKMEHPPEGAPKMAPEEMERRRLALMDELRQLDEMEMAYKTTKAVGSPVTAPGAVGNEGRPSDPVKDQNLKPAQEAYSKEAVEKMIKAAAAEAAQTAIKSLSPATMAKMAGSAGGAEVSVLDLGFSIDRTEDTGAGTKEYQDLRKFCDGAFKSGNALDLIRLERKGVAVYSPGIGVNEVLRAPEVATRN